MGRLQRRSKNNQGENHPMAKLNRRLVAEIREEYAKGGTSYAELAKKYKVDASSIGRVVRREVWPDNK